MADNPLLHDDGYRETEELLQALEEELQSLYGQAADEMQQKALDYMDSLIASSKEMQRKVQLGEISKEEYQRWLQSHLFTARYYQQMYETLAADLLNANMLAASIMNGYMPEVYAINMNYMTYAIEKAVKVNTLFTLYNRQAVERILRDSPDLLPNAKVDIPEDLRWSKMHLNNAVVQGILQGETIPEIASRLRTVADMDMRASIRNARTMTTSAQNGGRLDAMKRVEKMGAKVKKMWIATLDGRTRHAHRQLDGQKKPLNEPFESEFGKIRFPGDPEAHPSNVYNCRCSLVTEDPEFPTDASDLSMRDSKLAGMSYEEWKDKRPSYPAKKKDDKKSSKKRVNPDNPSYGYPETYGYTAEFSETIEPQGNTKTYHDQPIPKKRNKK